MVIQDLVVRTWPGGKNDAFLTRTLKFAQRRKWNMLFSAFRGALQKVRPGPLQRVMSIPCLRPRILSSLLECLCILRLLPLGTVEPLPSRSLQQPGHCMACLEVNITSCILADHP